MDQLLRHQRSRHAVSVMLSVLCVSLFVGDALWRRPESRFASDLEAFAVILLFAAAIAFLWSSRPASGQPRAQLPPGSKNPVIVVLAALTAIYLVASIAGLNGSSTALWRFVADRKSPEKVLIAGSAKQVRSDEWMIQTPWILSQSLSTPRFPLGNASIGDEKTPLVTNLPVRHWSMLFRPQMWLFFFAGFERAFAFYWNFKWFGLLLGAFLFFERLSGGKILPALAGAFFICFSPYLQWWFSTPTCLPEMLAMFFFALWAIDLILQAKSKWKIASAGLVLFGAITPFAFCSYPRFQIPLLYLAVVVVVALFVEHAKRDELFLFRIATGGLALTLSGIVVSIWFGEVAGLIQTIENLVYPGKSFSTGGGFPWYNLIAPFLEFSMTEQHHPPAAANVCEAAGFLFLFPFFLAVVIRDLVQRRVDPVLVALTSFSIFVLLFMLIGLPHWLTRASGWSYVYARRANLALGIASAIALVRYLARPGSNSEPSRRGNEILLFIAMSLVLCGVFWAVNTRLQSFVHLSAVCMAAVFFALTFLCLWTQRGAAAWTLLVIPLFCVNGLVNPIAQNLPALTRSDFRNWLFQNQRADPAAQWLVIGRSARSKRMAEFIKTTGARVIGGVRITPDAGAMQVLDPTNKYSPVHDRYAWSAFLPGKGPEPVFKLTYRDSYDVALPLDKIDIFDRLGVRYILAIDLPVGEAVVPGFKVVGERQRCILLKREAGPAE